MRRRLMWALIAAVVTGGGYASTLLATPGSGFSGSTIAVGRFDEFNLDTHTLPADFWQSRLQTKGLSDLYVQSNVWAPGATTGWHTHPGPSLVIVTAGTVTAYEGDDPSCTPQVYSQGMTFVDVVSHGHVHLVRNEGAIEARAIAVQLIPAAATRRIDEPAPGNCPF